MKINKAKGMSLLELTIVISIIAILTALIIPQFNRYTRNNALQSAARELAGDIKIIRQRAMAGGPTTVPLPYTLQFLNNTTYSYTVPSDILPYPALTFTKKVTNFSPDITFVQTFPLNTMTFQQRGTISETLGADRTITLTNGRGSTVVITANIVGRINVQYTPQ
ncbi:MAG: prepilin-type N-terminal cleavage/methylation domain-containing protein [Smithellaceae bacterium]